jgi:1-acyl-sn-glycerol-3-phosphate acyltransferase
MSGRVPRFLRLQLSRVILVVAVVLLLPTIAVVERVRRGAGRLVIRRCVPAVARLCGVVFEVRAAPDPDDAQSCVFVPNHSSLLDIPAVLMARPDVRFVAAAGLFHVPLLAAAMRALDTVPIERRRPERARRQLEELASSAGDGAFRIVIFPEGALAPPGGRLPFKTGAFALAIQAGVPVVPIAIHNTGRVLPPHTRLALRPGRVVVEVLAPVAVTGLGIDDRGALRDQVSIVVQEALRTAR